MKLWDFADPEDKLRPLCDDDDDDNHDELFLWYDWPTKDVWQPEPLSETFTIVNLRHASLFMFS